ncbi:MAG: family 20 glycosylhydrolase [Firmicutes bacterium]|nr:family 20 glycosylhydrolase [Bacillota bacterium]
MSEPFSIPLLPYPRKLARGQGSLNVRKLAALFVAPEATELEWHAAEDLAQDVTSWGLVSLRPERGGVLAGSAGAPATEPAVWLAVAGRDALPLWAAEGQGTQSGAQAGGEQENLAQQGPEAYRIRVGQHGILVLGASPAGVFCGVQTLLQLLASAEVGRSGNLPALEITDWPSYPDRGVMLDISRGRVPRLEDLLGLVDVLARLKINHLELYTEHTFRSRQHPAIGQDAGGLSAADLSALDRYARAHHVELVPNLQSFGHQHEILKLPQYAHLAESDDLWTLTPMEEGTYELLDQLYAELLPAFASKRFNVDCDETFDLGKGRSAGLAEQIGLGRVYMRHIQRLHELVSGKYGHQMMMWGDIVLHHRDLVPELPKDILLLNWIYEAAPRYEQVEPFAEAGVTQWVCPGTSSWNSLFPRLENALNNIRQFLADGRQVGAKGCLNTDWGDGGHYNLPGLSFYPHAYFAAEAWNPGALERDAFERAYGALAFGDDGEAWMKAHRALGEAVVYEDLYRMNGSQTCDLFFKPQDDDVFESVGEESVAKALDLAGQALDAVAGRVPAAGTGAAAPQVEDARTADGAGVQAGQAGQTRREGPHPVLFNARQQRLVRREVVLAGRQIQFAMERWKVVQVLKQGKPAGGGFVAAAARHLAQVSQALAEEFAALWRARSQEPGLAPLLERMAAVQKELRGE